MISASCDLFVTSGSVAAAFLWIGGRNKPPKGEKKVKAPPDVDDEVICIYRRKASNTTCWPSTRLMQRTRLSAATAQWAAAACKAYQHCSVNLYKYNAECHIVSVLLRNVTFRSVPVCCCSLGFEIAMLCFRHIS